MKGNRTLKLTAYIVLIAFVGIIWCWYTKNSTMQGVWSGAFLTAFATHGYLLNEIKETEE